MSDGSPGPGGGEFAPGAFRARFPRWVWVGLASWLLAGVVMLVFPALLGWLGVLVMIAFHIGLLLLGAEGPRALWRARGVARARVPAP